MESNNMNINASDAPFSEKTKEVSPRYNDQIEIISQILAKEGSGNENHAFSEFFIH